jgi:hypothetical protein
MDRAGAHILLLFEKVLQNLLYGDARVLDIEDLGHEVVRIARLDAGAVVVRRLASVAGVTGGGVDVRVHVTVRHRHCL